MNIVLDLLVIVVVGFLVFGGYKRGIIKTVTELISAALSTACIAENHSNDRNSRDFRKYS